MSATGIAAGLTAIALAGCQSNAAPEESVYPGINDPYLAEDLDLGEWTARFEREGRTVYDHRTDIVAALNLAPGEVVADVGAGTGLFVPRLAEAVGPDGVVYAVDIAPDFLAHIETRVRDLGLSNVATVLCTERSVNLPEASIDVAFLCDVYHHFEYPQSSLASMLRALRPAGRLAVVDFHRKETSGEWILEHVRADRDAVLEEIVTSGFVFDAEVVLTDDTYLLLFSSPPD